jgi:Flp pilus assembly protein TadG
MIHQTRHRWNRGRRGNAIVEASLVLTLTIVLLVVILEVGMAMATYQAMTETCRKAVRYAVVNPYDETSIKNVAAYGNAAGAGSSIFGLRPENVTIAVENVDSVNAVIKVTIVRPSYRFLIPFLGTSPFSMRVQAVRLLEGQGSTG